MQKHKLQEEQRRLQHLLGSHFDPDYYRSELDVVKTGSTLGPERQPKAPAVSAGQNPNGKRKR